MIIITTTIIIVIAIITTSIIIIDIIDIITITITITIIIIIIIIITIIIMTHLRRPLSGPAAPAAARAHAVRRVREAGPALCNLSLSLSPYIYIHTYTYEHMYVYMYIYIYICITYVPSYYLLLLILILLVSFIIIIIVVIIVTDIFIDVSQRGCACQEASTRPASSSSSRPPQVASPQGQDRRIIIHIKGEKNTPYHKQMGLVKNKLLGLCFFGKAKLPLMKCWPAQVYNNYALHD